MNEDMTVKSNHISQVLNDVVVAAISGSTSLRQLAIAGNLVPEVDFVGAPLMDLDLRDENLSGFNFSGANLSGADFRRAEISNTLFLGANLAGAVGLPAGTDRHSTGMQAAMDKRWVEAHRAFDEAVDLARKFGDAGGVAIELMCAGYALRQVRGRRQASERFYEAFKIWDHLGNLGRAITAWQNALECSAKNDIKHKQPDLLSPNWISRYSIRPLVDTKSNKGRYSRTKNDPVDWDIDPLVALTIEHSSNRPHYSDRSYWNSDALSDVVKSKRPILFDERQLLNIVSQSRNIFYHGKERNSPLYMMKVASSWRQRSSDVYL